MAWNDYALAKRRTEDYLERAKIKHHMSHGPGPDYWNAPLRVLAVNMESYGYEGCGRFEVNLECLIGWMYGGGKSRTRTVRYTMAIIRVILDGFTEGAIPSYESLRSAYADRETLNTVVRKVAYYNIRNTSNPHKNQDVASIIASGQGEMSQLIHNEMLALEPQVILVSGKAGLASFNEMWKLVPAMAFHGRIRHANGSLIQSIKHPSRPSYAKSVSTIAELLCALKEKA